MGYYVNQNIPYVAVGNCQDPYNGPYTYTWTFEDSTQQTGGSVTKAWATAGAHSASVSCLNTSTGDTASAQNIITVLGYSESFTAASARYGAAVVELIDGRLFVISGYNTTSCYFVDPNTLVSTLTTPIPTGYMSQHAAVVLNDGRVLVGGGENNTNFYIFSPANQTWTQVASPIGFPATFTVSGPTLPILMSLTLLPDGKVLGIPYAYRLTYSSSRDAAAYRFQVYDPVSNTWDNSIVSGTLGDPVYPSNTIKLNNNKIFIHQPKYRYVGSTFGIGEYYIYDTVLNTLSSVKSTGIYNNGSCCMSLSGNDILMYGCENNSVDQNKVYKYIASSDSVVSTGYDYKGATPAEIRMVSISASGGGIVGFGGSTVTGSINPVGTIRSIASTGQQTELTPMAVERQYHNVVKHSNGKAYVMFGQKTDTNPTDTCYVYLV